VSDAARNFDHPLNGVIWLQEAMKGMTIEEMIAKDLGDPKPTEDIIVACIRRAIYQFNVVH
jgi:hypothetical protein